MFLSQLIIDPRNKFVRRDLGNCYELHRTILSAFPEKDHVEFKVLFRLEESALNKRTVVLVQSDICPDWKKLPGGYLIEQTLSNDITDSSLIKDLLPLLNFLENGMQARFRLYANPTKKIETSRKGDTKKTNGKRIPLLTDYEQVDWLKKKGKLHGFELLEISIQTRNLSKLTGTIKNSAEKNNLTFYGVHFEGKLRITDLENFKDAIKNGIGSGKAFGYGLLSISPIISN